MASSLRPLTLLVAHTDPSRTLRFTPTAAVRLKGVGRAPQRGMASLPVRSAVAEDARAGPAATDGGSKVGGDGDPAGALKAGIAEFYDESSGVWEDMWGEHMHHGYYEPGATAPPQGAGEAAMKAHQRAQIEMIEKSLAFAGVAAGSSPAPRRIVDVGCGIAGSARYLARKYPGSSAVGITLSPKQAQRGNELCEFQGLADRVKLMVADAMDPPFEDGSFDLVWSMESGEHMPDKPKFVGQLARLAAPGGKIIIVTWCHRNLDSANGETALKDWEKGILDQVCNMYYLPQWCSADDYERIAGELGLKNVKVADWTEVVTPFWPAVIASALTLRGFMGLLKSGWKTIQGALAMYYMVRGYSQGVIKFIIITAEK